MQRNALSRRAFLAAIGGSAAALASGCGSGDFVQVTGEVPAKYAKRTHIVLWYSFGGINQEALQKLIDEFHEVQDEIYVEAQFQGSYEQTQQKLAAGIIAKQVPDLVTLSEVTWRKMHLADTLEPLNDYFGDGFTPDQYIDQFIEEGTVQDTVWWIPFARSTPLFYFNKSVFREAGVPDRGPKTWTELKEWAPDLMKVKTKSGHPRVLAHHSIYASWYFQGNVWQWGANYSEGLKMTFTDERVIEAGNWMVDFIRKDKAAYLSGTPDVDVQNGAALCLQSSTGSLRNLTELAKAADFELGTTFLPEHEHFGCPTGGSGFGILAGSTKERKQAAFEFIKFLGRPEKSAQWTMETGYLPVVKAAQQVPALVDLTRKDPNFGTALRQLPKTQPQDLARLIVSSGGEMMDSALQQLYSSNLRVEDVFARLGKQLQSKADLIEASYEAHYN